MGHYVETRRYLAGRVSRAQNRRLLMVFVILAIIFVVLLFAYVRVRSRRLSR
jgi:ABC-type Mn2+/Zn2+ transport system permease subunit